MASDVLPSRTDPVRQLSVLADNKVGRLHEIIQLLSSHDLHVVALSILDTTDSSIVRLVVDRPDEAARLFGEHGYAVTEQRLVAVVVASEDRLRHVTAALLQAEINLHYCYPFLVRPGGECALALRVEDPELAESVLSACGMRTLTHRDIAR